MKTAIAILSLFFCFSLFAQTTKSKTVTKTSKKTVKTNPTKIPKDVQVWIVDAQKAKCEGITTSMCLLVKKQNERDFNLFYDNIEGFSYEEGFLYTIWIKEEPKSDTEKKTTDNTSLYKYTLVKVVSKKSIAGYSNTTTVDNSKPLSNINTSKTTTLIVNEEKAPCEGNPDAKCLLIKKEGAKEFEIFYQGIEGFTFKEGYRQTILVNERPVANPMVKQVEPIYTLVKVLKNEFIFDAKKVSMPDITAPKTTLGNKWFLRKMQESDSSSFVMDDNSVWIQFDTVENKVNGKAPCNSYFGAFTSDFVSTFQTMAVASTRMYCEANMKYEDLYFTLLQNADNFIIKDGKLSLYKGKRLLLIFD